jgi:hypothetical protein
VQEVSVVKRPGRWWKAFAIGAVIWFVGTLGIYVSDPSVVSVASIADLLFSAFLVFGLLGYAFQRRFFAHRLWQVTVPLAPAWDLAYPLLLLPSPPPNGSRATAIAVALLFITVALFKYLALFRYAFRSPRIWAAPDLAAQS